MSYFEQFNKWNTNNPYLSVTAEQYSIITKILKSADKEIQENEKNKDYIIALSNLLNKEDIKTTKIIRNFIISLFVLISFYSGMVYLLIR